MSDISLGGDWSGLLIDAVIAFLVGAIAGFYFSLHYFNKAQINIVLSLLSSALISVVSGVVGVLVLFRFLGSFLIGQNTYIGAFYENGLRFLLILEIILIAFQYFFNRGKQQIPMDAISLQDFKKKLFIVTIPLMIIGAIIIIAVLSSIGNAINSIHFSYS
jgi:hypothetical protein